MKTNMMLLALLAAAALPAVAQPVFEDVTPTGGPWFVTPDTDDFWINSIAPADVEDSTVIWKWKVSPLEDGGVAAVGARRRSSKS